MSRRAYFKSLPSVDSDQNAALAAIASTVQQLQFDVTAVGSTATGDF